MGNSLKNIIMAITVFVNRYPKVILMDGHPCKFTAGLPDTGSAIEELDQKSGIDSFIDQVKSLVEELGMLKSLTGLAILVAIIVAIIFSIRRAHRRRKQKKILSKLKHSEYSDAPVMDEIEDFDTDDLTEENDSDGSES
jgi:hypothetical protein